MPVSQAQSEQNLAEQAADGQQFLVRAIKLPPMDGVDFLRRIKADPKTAKLPVIVLTTTDNLARSSAATNWTAS